MSTISSTDRSELESQLPMSSLLEWRKAREEARYREWCVAMYEMVEMGEERFHPADILDRLSPEAARLGRADAHDSFRSEVEEKVCEQFPCPVAVPFHAFLHGSSEPLLRLYGLRDAWEGLIHLIFALSLSEATTSLKGIWGFKIRESEYVNVRDCKQRDLVGDRLSTKIGIAEALLNQFRILRIADELTEVLSPGIIAEIRRLNSVRNEFSHLGALSELQATALIEEAYPSFLEIMVDIADLSNIELVRIRGIRPGSPSLAEVERLTGHALSRRIRALELKSNTSSVVLAAGRVGDLDRVLVEIGTRILDLSPFFYACDDESGHRTRVMFFKSKGYGNWKFEIVGESVTVDRESYLHDNQLKRFDAILGVHRDRQE
jgi:hypothetical protein